jgi:hypothetical protein
MIMAKRRTKMAQQRAKKRAEHKIGQKNPGGQSRYAKKRAESSYRPTSPFYPGPNG